MIKFILVFSPQTPSFYYLDFNRFDNDSMNHIPTPYMSIFRTSITTLLSSTENLEVIMSVRCWRIFFTFSIETYLPLSCIWTARFTTWELLPFITLMSKFCALVWLSLGLTPLKPLMLSEWCLIECLSQLTFTMIETGGRSTRHFLMTSLMDFWTSSSVHGGCRLWLWNYTTKSYCSSFIL